MAIAYIVIPDLNEMEIIGSCSLLACADDIIALYLCTTRRIQIGTMLKRMQKS